MTKVDISKYLIDTNKLKRVSENQIEKFNHGKSSKLINGEAVITDRSWLLLTLVDNLFVHIYNEIASIKQYEPLKSYMNLNMNTLFSVKKSEGQPVYAPRHVNMYTNKDVGNPCDTSKLHNTVKVTTYIKAVMAMNFRQAFSLNIDNIASRCVWPLDRDNKYFSIARDIVRSCMGVNVLLFSVHKKDFIADSYNSYMNEEMQLV